MKKVYLAVIKKIWKWPYESDGDLELLAAFHHVTLEVLEREAPAPVLLRFWHALGWLWYHQPVTGLDAIHLSVNNNFIYGYLRSIIIINAEAGEYVHVAVFITRLRKKVCWIWLEYGMGIDAKIHKLKFCSCFLYHVRSLRCGIWIK